MTGPVTLRDKLHQAVHGFSQLATCLCQGALVQVRKSAHLSRAEGSILGAPGMFPIARKVRVWHVRCLEAAQRAAQLLEHVIVFQSSGLAAPAGWRNAGSYQQMSYMLQTCLRILAAFSKRRRSTLARAPAMGAYILVQQLRRGLAGLKLVPRVSAMDAQSHKVN